MFNNIFNNIKIYLIKFNILEIGHTNRKQVKSILKLLFKFFDC